MPSGERGNHSIWFHKISNVHNHFPKSGQPASAADMRNISHEATRAGALAAVVTFKEKFAVKYAKRVACLTKDTDALLAFCDAARRSISFGGGSELAAWRDPGIGMGTESVRHRPRTRGGATACLATCRPLAEGPGGGPEPPRTPLPAAGHRGVGRPRSIHEADLRPPRRRAAEMPRLPDRGGGFPRGTRLANPIRIRNRGGTHCTALISAKMALSLQRS